MRGLTQVKHLWLGLLVFVLVACGGGNAGDEPATVVPTLTDAERATFAPGLAENPLQMVLRPVRAVEDTVVDTINDLVDAEVVSPDTSFADDLEIEPSDLNASLSEAFGVSIALDNEAVSTVSDAISVVHRTLGQQISDELLSRSGLYVDVLAMDSPSDVLRALCDSDQGIVSIAWMDGVTYAAADAQACGDPELQIVAGDERRVALIDVSELPVLETAVLTATLSPDVTPSPEPTATETSTPTPEPTATLTPDTEPEETPESTPQPEEVGEPNTGTQALIIFHRALGTDDVSAVQGRIFCRLGFDDFETWLLPSLVMIANDLNPRSDLGEVVDYATVDLLVSAVAEGRCDAAGLTRNMFDALAPELAEGVRVAANSERIPYAILMYPLEVQLGVRLSLNEVFVELASDADEGMALRWLLGQQAVIPILEGDLAAFAAYMQVTGLDFEQLGN